jgi:hypothetical protein
VPVVTPLKADVGYDSREREIGFHWTLARDLIYQDLGDISHRVYSLWRAKLIFLMGKDDVYCDRVVYGKPTMKLVHFPRRLEAVHGRLNGEIDS